MKKYLLSRTFVIGVLILLVGASVVSSIESDSETLTKVSNIGTLDVSEGLVAYWSFDYNDGSIAYDESENNNDGFITGATWTAGISGNALDFDGVNDYVEVSTSSSLNFGSGDFSISAWVRTDNSKIDDLQIVEKMDRESQAPFTGYYLRISHLSSYENKAEPCLSDGTNEVEIFGNEFVSDNEWHFIVATFDRDDKLTLYVDSEFETSEDIDIVGNIDVASPLYIGQQDNNDNRFIGQIDEIRFYNRVITIEEIDELFNNPAGLKKTLMFGKLVDSEDVGNLIIFNAVKIRCIRISPFEFIRLTAGEKIKISEDYKGILTSGFALGIFDVNI